MTRRGRIPRASSRSWRPAAPGGGWDTTARAFQERVAGLGKLDEGIEVFNVEGAGGTLGLSQLVSKDSGDPYQLMMTGLVMLGAIETNGSDVPLTRTTPIATMITETEGIVVPAKSKYQSLKELSADFKRDPGSIRWAGGSAGSTDQLLVGELARVARGRPVQDEVRRALRRRRGQRGDPVWLGRRRRLRAERVRRPGRGGQDAAAGGLLARSTSRSAGRKPKTIKDEGDRPRADQLARADRAAGDLRR